MIRITGRVGQAPTFEYLYRRGTLLNLVGEKTSEFHTARAVTKALERWLHIPGAVKEYTVAGHFHDGRGRYTFYVELADHVVTPSQDLPELTTWLDEALGESNPYYRSTGRGPERLDAPELKFVCTGTFAALLALQLRRATPATASQIKIPRRVTSAEQLALLEDNVLPSSNVELL